MQTGTKMAAQYSPIIAPGETAVIRLRLTGAAVESGDPFDGEFDRVLPSASAKPMSSTAA
jgi:hypothetical protein